MSFKGLKRISATDAVEIDIGNERLVVTKAEASLSNEGSVKTSLVNQSAKYKGEFANVCVHKNRDGTFCVATGEQPMIDGKVTWPEDWPKEEAVLGPGR